MQKSSFANPQKSSTEENLPLYSLGDVYEEIELHSAPISINIFLTGQAIRKLEHIYIERSIKICYALA